MKRSPSALSTVLRFGAAPVLLAAATLTLSACLGNEARDPDRNEVHLTGRVVSSANAPVAGVVVRLAKSGVSDTTDATGRYHLGKASASIGKGIVLDTLYYAMNGLSLARVSVTSWIDSLPDVEVVQRDISGLLDSGSVAIGKVEAVVTGDGIEGSSPVVTEFYYNALTGNYSGFVYFPPATTVRNYAVRINVYGPGDVFAGRSVSVPFNSFAGNITVPMFKAGNAQPVAKAGLDTAVAVSATVQLRGAAADSFGGTITKWEWSIGGGSFVETSTGDTSFSRGSEGAYACVLRVTDDDGNQALDTVIATVIDIGTTWTSRASGTTSSLNSVVWTGTRFVTAATTGMVLTSPDGITWTASAMDTLTPRPITSIAWNGRRLIATSPSISSSGGVLYFSADGLTWTTSLLPFVPGGSGTLLISAADTTFIVANRSNIVQHILRSENDGATWVMDTLPRETGGLLSSGWTFAKHAGRLVGLGGNGSAFSTVSGGTWTRHTATETFPRPDGGHYDYTMMSVVSTGSHAVAVGYAGHVMRSTDGMTWQQPRVAADIPEQGSGSTAGDLNGVTWTGSALFAVGNGYIVASADGGENWAQVRTNTNLRSVATNGSRLVAVGGGGMILTSD